MFIRPIGFLRNTPKLTFSETQSQGSSDPYTPFAVFSVGKDSVQLSTPPIVRALKELEQIEFDKNDIKYIESMGIKPTLKSGKEVIDVIKNNSISVCFGKTDEVDVHAQWDNAQNKIVINEKYKDTRNFAEILAIACAIGHEAGHAKDKDNISSVQEELDNLAVNVLLDRAFDKKYGLVIHNEKNSDIIAKGVNLYSELFFKKGGKLELISHVSSKYGDLPVSSPNHSPSDTAIKISDVW